MPWNDEPFERQPDTHWQGARPPFEERMVLSYLAGLSRAHSVDHRAAEAIFEWVQRHSGLLEPIEQSGPRSEPTRRCSSPPQRIPISEMGWDEAQSLIEKRIHALSDAPPSLIERAARELSSILGLNSLEYAIVGLALRRDMYDDLSWVFKGMELATQRALRRDYATVGLVLGHDREHELVLRKGSRRNEIPRSAFSSSEGALQ